MIYKKDLKIYEIDTIEKYFDMVVESENNGQFTQVVDQLANMSLEQRFDFLEYLIGSIYIELAVSERTWWIDQIKQVSTTKSL
jgi:hypothetical protein